MKGTSLIAAVESIVLDTNDATLCLTESSDRVKDLPVIVPAAVVMVDLRKIE